jgi:glycosyltransferase involved in cell wall biosynthesis
MASGIIDVVPGSGASRLREPVRITEQRWPDGTLPVVSVACATYNHEKFIAECLDGFLIQETTFPVEIIVQDDASTDRTPVIIREYQSRHPRLFRTVLQTENQWSRGRKVFSGILQLARGEYVALCEGDDYWVNPEKLEKQVAILEQDPECVGVFHPAKWRDEPSGIIASHGLYGPRFQAAKFTLDMLLEYGLFIPTCTALTRLACSTRFQNFDLGPSYEDFAFHVLNTLQGPYAFINEPMAVYRYHPGGMFSGLSELEKLTRPLQSTEHLATKLGLKKRRAFKDAIASQYWTIRAFHAAKWNVKETLRTTLKAFPYVSWRMYPFIIARDCKYLVFWFKQRLFRRNPTK